MRQIVRFNKKEIGKAFQKMMDFIAGDRTIIEMRVIARRRFPREKTIDTLVLRMPVATIRRVKVRRLRARVKE
jgi:hypothetical protein